MTGRTHRGVAVAALAAVGLVTAAWWALALYPVASAPDWVNRTRLACFGAAPGGPPNAGGWVFLVGEPVGMLAMLFAAWGDAVRADLRWLASRAVGRAALGLAIATMALAALGAASVIRRDGDAAEPFPDGAARPVSIDVPALALVDQHGGEFDLKQVPGPVIVTFAFAHCETMCPTQVRELLRLREETGRRDVPLVIVTVDPWRDVPARLASIASAWNLAAGDRVLSGDVERVNATLDSWNIPRQRDEATGDVLHALVTVFVRPGGRKATRMDAVVEPLRSLLAGS